MLPFQISRSSLMRHEKKQNEIEQQKKVNESLTMKVNELTAYDKVKDVASDMGLAYNNDNIRLVK